MIGIPVSASGIIGALRFPDQNTVLNVHIPGTRAGAIDPVGGTNLLVVLPAAAIEIFPFPLAATGLCPVVGRFFFPATIVLTTLSEKPEGIQEAFFGHNLPPM
jgi:hypothetical protein